MRNRNAGRVSGKVQALVNGRWDMVFAQLVPELAEAMEAAAGRRKPKHVGCPVHGGVDGFRFFEDWREVGGSVCNSCGVFGDGIATIAWLRQISYTDALKLLFDFLEDKPMPTRAPVDRAKIVKSNAEADKRAVYAVRKVWSESIGLDASEAEPARMYFARRGLQVPVSDAIRFCPRAQYIERVKSDDGRERKVRSYWPAIVLRVSDGNGKPVTLHRTYVTRDGHKAPVDAVKKMMPYPSNLSVTGSAVRLSADVPEVLGVAEGLETALAVGEATGMTVWPCLSAQAMEAFVIPESVKQIIVWADKDSGGRGRNAAVELCRRAWEQDVHASAVAPAMDLEEGQKSIDWLDVLNRLGPDGLVRSLDRSPSAIADLRRAS